MNSHKYTSILARLLMLTLVTCLPLRTGAEEPQHLRVVTWNIEWFPGRTPQPTARAEAAHREDVAEYLPTLEPDILMLQEIRNREAAQFLVDQFPGLELHVVSTFQRPDPRISQQIVIASSFKALESYEERFTGEAYDYGDEEPYRGYVFTALESPFGGTLLVYAVHLKSNWGERDVNIAMRESGARQILKHVARKEARYADRGPIQVIIGGDLNVRLNLEDLEDERTIDIFTEAGFHSSWQTVPFEERITWPPRGGFPPACFDYIFTKGLPALTAEILLKPAWALSDHRPVLLSIPRNKQTN
ncbi:MAG: endonuclease/exonuclease/phosphatase family protein [Kiritimatiellia bacterium]